MSTAFVSVVLPCLNEAELLLDTCTSLGFDPDLSPAPDSNLVIVDNGSIDGTVFFAEHLRDSLPTGKVIVVTETERGYVPPRLKGNKVAASAALSMGVNLEDLLIIQADADTKYSEAYIEQMRDSACGEGKGVLVDACVTCPNDILDRFAQYFRFWNQFDNLIISALSDSNGDVIIDDKACAYWYTDYINWGEHRREFDFNGDEIFAETTRLFIRGRKHGARRILCADAIATHSARRLLSEPAIFTATAGFPRGQRFRSEWLRKYNGPNELSELIDFEDSDLAIIKATRSDHLWGIFELLPACVAQTFGSGQIGLYTDRTQDELLNLIERFSYLGKTAPETVIFSHVLKAIDSL